MTDHAPKPAPDTPTSLRGAVYVLASVLTALAVAYGLIAQDVSALWSLLAVAVFDVAALVLARLNLAPRPPAGRE